MTPPAVALIQGRFACTKVSPSQATPRIQIQALIPALNVLELSTASVLAEQSRVVKVATLSIMIKIALVVVMIGVTTHPSPGLLIMAYTTTLNTPAKNNKTDNFARGLRVVTLSPRSATSPSSKRFK